MSPTTTGNTSEFGKTRDISSGAPELHEEPVGISQQILEAVLEGARERPGAALLWSFAVGFVLGWRLRPW